MTISSQPGKYTMPLYEYICENCDEELEVLQKITDEALTHCPHCNKDSLRKKTSRSAFHLKGGGWYKDGYSVPENGEKSDSVSKTESTKATDKTSEKSDSGKSESSESKTTNKAGDTTQKVPDTKAS